jgi:hypothetical protein
VLKNHLLKPQKKKPLEEVIWIDQEEDLIPHQLDLELVKTTQYSY